MATCGQVERSVRKWKGMHVPLDRDTVPPFQYTTTSQGTIHPDTLYTSLSQSDAEVAGPASHIDKGLSGPGTEQGPHTPSEGDVPTRPVLPGRVPLLEGASHAPGWDGHALYALGGSGRRWRSEEDGGG